ncbi:MAG TPA: hypothetical protein EYN96_13500 [Candidatus Hydrogenedentes bacterium]|nr:hypothetical protein [Candidatus Hydrogenedentota bacterium]
MRTFCIAITSIFFVGCGGGVGNTILQDFGIRDRPEDYVSGADRVMESMRAVGATEIKRLNSANRHGEIRYDGSDALRGKFYKEVRVYTKSYPLDAQPIGRQGNRKETGFRGLIEYAYVLNESARFANRTEAAAANADIPGRAVARERYRYRFTSGGAWDGGKGELVRQ